MVFVACGLNFKTAPIDMREKFSLTPEAQEKLLSQLLESFAVNEAVYLSTCNRSELYCETAEPQALLSALAQYYQICEQKLKSYIYLHQAEEGIRHTLRVATGLDSMMLGEPQILGQMKQSFQFANQFGSIKKNLLQIFIYIFAASKRIRNQSGIGNNPISLAYAAVQCIAKVLPNFASQKVLLIGAGETAALVAKYLQKQGVKNFMVASRTIENAQKLAANFKGQALDIVDIPQCLYSADIVISATACPLPFISKSLVRHSLLLRNNQPMFFLDLAMPRDIEPEVKELAGAHLLNLDDLYILTESGLKQRHSAALLAEQLIEEELANYIRWHRVQKSKVLLRNYRDTMHNLAQKELIRAKNKLAQGNNQELVLQEFCARLLNKLTHYPTIGIRKAAGENRQDLLDLAQFFLNTNHQP